MRGENPKKACGLIQMTKATMPARMPKKMPLSAKGRFSRTGENAGADDGLKGEDPVFELRQQEIFGTLEGVAEHLVQSEESQEGKNRSV